jgi:AraC-like DNA-binding protein
MAVMPLKSICPLDADARSQAHACGQAHAYCQSEARSNPNHGAARQWRHDGHTTAIGDLTAHAAILEQLELELEPQNDLCAILIFGGSLVVEQPGQSLHCASPGVLLVSSPAWRCLTNSSSLVVLNVKQLQLHTTVMAMVENRPLPQHWQQRLQPDLLWRADKSAACPALKAGLAQMLSIANNLLDYGPGLVGRLGLDQMVYRMLAAILIPELRLNDSLKQLQSRKQDGQDRFTDLIAYIEAHVHQPLGLEQLERRSHYSRRTLQYTFQQRLGCSPSQWIRSVRLERAKANLQHPQPGDSVTRIAKACGYRSLNLFSQDFQQRFQVKPSELLRESQAKLPVAQPSRTNNAEDGFSVA